ncbi:MAG: Mut7-C RNAse domain-containing protein [Actinomycetota bacterium]|nr:Mut7-C RNAse domain-containing protein [Actinomycetota bacterium]
MAPSCTLRVYGDLNDFLPPGAGQRATARPAAGRPTVKDVIEAAGVPHPEVDLVVIDGTTVDLRRRVEPGERIAAYPWMEALRADDGANLLPAPRAAERFVLDGHLGRLARLLRLCGFDVRYERDADDPELAERSAEEDRTLLTRDIGLLKRSVVRRGRWVRATDPRRQALEVLHRYPPGPEVVPFTRCLVCNGTIGPADRDAVDARVPERSREAFDDFTRCSSCGRVYWEGSHHEDLVALVSDLATQLAVAGRILAWPAVR